MIPLTTMRVSLHTHEKLNEQVRQRMRDTIHQVNQDHPQALEQRLRELDREWDTDRVMETMSSLMVLAGVVLALVNPWWLLLAGVAAVGLLSHGLVGWDPLLPLYRGWGVRTSSEIDNERYALKALRGDFHHLSWFTTPADRDAIARLEGEGGPVHNDLQPSESSDQAVEEALAAARK